MFCPANQTKEDNTISDHYNRYGCTEMGLSEGCQDVLLVSSIVPWEQIPGPWENDELDKTLWSLLLQEDGLDLVYCYSSVECGLLLNMYLWGPTNLLKCSAWEAAHITANLYQLVIKRRCFGSCGKLWCCHFSLDCSLILVLKISNYKYKLLFILQTTGFCMFIERWQCCHCQWWIRLEKV